MFSKDPSELTRKEKLSDEEISRSIRLALAAELDAVNFYLQQSSVIPEGSFKKVHEDIAREEVAHFGEFLRLLYEYEPKEFEKIREGWEEASGLLSTGTPHAAFLENHTDGEKMKEGEIKNDEKIGIKAFEQFREIEWQDAGIQFPEDETKILPFPRIVYEFSVKKGGLELYREEAVRKHMKAYERMIAEELLTKHDLSLERRSATCKPGDWTKSGQILEDAMKAMEMLIEEGYDGKVEVLASPAVLPMLLRQSGDSGQTELDLINEGVGKVTVSPYLRGKKIFVLSPKAFWILIKEHPRLREISETAESRHYLIEGKVAPLLFDKNASILMDWKK